MPPSAPSASNRALILAGFDRDVQLELDVDAFFSCGHWIRRVYTKETDSYIINRLAAEDRHVKEVRLQTLRYGNNITVLFRACYKLSKLYGSPGFWHAISRGFSSTARATEDMVDMFIHAREVYRKLHSSDHSQFRSGATVAVDDWIRFLYSRPDTFRPQSHATGSEETALKEANRFYEGSKTKFLQIDSGGVFNRRGIEEIQHTSRKRSPSPTPPGPPPQEKRRPSPNRFESRDRSATPDKRVYIPPMATDLNTQAHSSQEYQTPSTAYDEGRQDELYAPKRPIEPYEHRIRGISRNTHSRSPSWSAGNHNFVTENGRSCQGPELRNNQTNEENYTPAPPKDDDSILEKFERKFASLEKRLMAGKTHPMASDEVIQNMQEKIESLEKKLVESEDQRLKDSRDAKKTITSFETKLSTIEASRPKYEETIQSLQDRLATAEANIALGRSHSPKIEENGSVSKTSKYSTSSPQAMQHDTEDIMRKIKNLPTTNLITEKIFQIEQNIRTTFQEYQRDNNERMDGTTKDLNTFRVQVKELAKQFDMATAGLPERNSFTALETQVSSLSNKLDTIQQDKTKQNQLAILEGRVNKMSIDIRAVLRQANTTALSDQLQGLSEKVNSLQGLAGEVSSLQQLAARVDSLQQAVEDTQKGALADEVAALDTRVDIIAKRFMDLLRQFYIPPTVVYH